jgi:hypothetical protein
LTGLWAVGEGGGGYCWRPSAPRGRAHLVRPAGGRPRGRASWSRGLLSSVPPAPSRGRRRLPAARSSSRGCLAASVGAAVSVAVATAAAAVAVAAAFFAAVAVVAFFAAAAVVVAASVVGAEGIVTALPPLRRCRCLPLRLLPKWPSSLSLPPCQSLVPAAAAAAPSLPAALSAASDGSSQPVRPAGRLCDAARCPPASQFSAAGPTCHSASCEPVGSAGPISGPGPAGGGSRMAGPI